MTGRCIERRSQPHTVAPSRYFLVCCWVSFSISAPFSRRVKQGRQKSESVFSRDFSWSVVWEDLGFGHRQKFRRNKDREPRIDVRAGRANIERLSSREAIVLERTISI